MAPCWGEEFWHFKIKDRKKWESFGGRQGRVAKYSSFESDPLLDGPVYKRIMDYFGQNYQEIADRQFHLMEKDQNRFKAGINHLAFDYFKSFAYFSVEFQRQMAPNLFADNYVINDTINIYIDATQFLGDLKQRGIIDIGKKQLLGFAGVTFKRSYQYSYFAKNKTEAMTLYLRRLFFSFLKFRSKNFLKMKPEEVMVRTDRLGFQVGGISNIPIYEYLDNAEAELQPQRNEEEDDDSINYFPVSNFFALNLNGHLAHHLLTRTEIVALTPEEDFTQMRKIEPSEKPISFKDRYRQHGDSGEEEVEVELEIEKFEEKGAHANSFQIHFSKGNISQAGIQVTILADFLKLLRTKIFSYSFSKSFENSYEMGFGFGPKDVSKIKGTNPLATEVGRILKHKEPNLGILKNNLLGKVLKEIQTKRRTCSLFTLIRSKLQKTERVEIINDKRYKNFFRHEFFNSKYQNSSLGWLLSLGLQSFLRLSWSFGGQTYKDAQKLILEYDSEKNLIKDKASLNLEQNAPIFRFHFKREFSYQKRNKEKSKAKLLDLIENYSTLRPQIIERVKKGELMAPFDLKINFVFKQSAIEYFHNLSLSEINKKIRTLCLPSQKRQRVMKKGSFRWETENKCSKKLAQSYQKYINERDKRYYSAREKYQKCRKKNSRRTNRKLRSCPKKIVISSQEQALKKIPLWLLTPFLQDLQKWGRNKSFIYDFFGRDNVSMNGQFKAAYEIEEVEGEYGNFNSFFNDGTSFFKGLIEQSLPGRARHPALDKI